MKIKKILLSIACLFAGLVTTVTLSSCGGTQEAIDIEKVAEVMKYDLSTIPAENIHYVSPNAPLRGTDGTKENPHNFQIAILPFNVKPGDYIILMEGTYKYNSRIQIGPNGSEINGMPNKYITVRPEYAGDKVVFDFSEMSFNGNNRGIQLYSDFWHIYGIDICGAGDNGMYVSGSHNIIEACNFYNNRDTGLQLGRGYSEQIKIDQWPCFNLIKNCTSFANYDDETKGENADGFAAKLTVGYGNVFDGCIAFRNSDDGWDLYAKEDSGNIGTVVIYNCVSFENGFLPYKIERQGDGGTTYLSYNTPDGDGIGFKLGGSTMEGDVLVYNCLSFNNKLHGFGDNSNPGVLSLKNCTAFNNCIGLTDNGLVNERGIEDSVNKSNNFDLARDTNSYNNYYGLVSYINNQKNFRIDEDDSNYNVDQYRGSMAYSIMQPEYKKDAEVYMAYKNYGDVSSWQTDRIDVSFSKGEVYTGMSDASFANLDPVNAVCNNTSELRNLLSVNKIMRNADDSINLGDRIKIVDNNLLTFAEGNAIGHNLSKSTYAEYKHYTLGGFEECKTANDVCVKAASNVIEILADKDAIFQDFEIPKFIYNCDIKWSSSNESILSINSNEKIAVSKAIYSTVNVTTPQEDTKVTLTATIKCGNTSITRDFELIVRSRNQLLGELVNTGSTAVRVDVLGTYYPARVYATDSSSSTGAELDSSLYDLTYTYKYALDGNSKFYTVDGVYTSNPGVYEVTVTATSKVPREEGATKSTKFNVYVVDPDCSIDFKANTNAVALNRDGYEITGSLSNIDGYVYSITSSTARTGITADDIIHDDNVQVQQITTDSIIANYTTAHNAASEAYYVYYVVTNRNVSKKSSVYSKEITVQNITTCAEFMDVARKSTTSATTIYSLQNDLDFASYTNSDWDTALAGVQTFKGLLNGNNHTISNISIEPQKNSEGKLTIKEKMVNIFYKVNGTIMNLKFNNTKIINTDSSAGKQTGIIGELQGGYLHNIHINNMTASAYQSLGGLVGQITGGYNYITQCSLVNDTNNTLSVTGKYVGGIVGNVQKNSDQTYVQLYVENCYVNADIGKLNDKGIGVDSGGCTGGIVGRVKNDSETYETTVIKCVYYGRLIAKGNYNGGMVGSFESGMGNVTVKNCFADCTWNHNGLIYDAKATVEAKEEFVTTYAHKNCNPMIGRYTNFQNKIDTKSNIGTFKEYSALVHSNGMYVDWSGYDEDTGEVYIFQMNISKVNTTLKLDTTNIWQFENGIISLRIPE